MQQLVIIGTNYRRSNLDLREHIQRASQKKTNMIPVFIDQGHAKEAMLLTTCHRTELYLAGADVKDPAALFAELFELPNDDVADAIYCHRDVEVRKHLFRLAVGLDSMIIGESRILNQIKQAYMNAQQKNCIGSSLGKLVPAALSVSKRVRHNTQIGAHPISIAYMIKKKVKSMFSKLSHLNVLFIGAGNMIVDVAKYLGNDEFASVTFTNRSYSKAKQLADMYHGQAVGFNDLEQVLAHTDIVVTATASQHVLLTKVMVEKMMVAKSQLLLVDLAVPRDIEPSCAGIKSVSYYHLDDFQILIRDSLASREYIAKQAESLLETELDEHLGQLQLSNQSAKIHHFRHYGDAIKDEVIQKALRRLAQGESAEKVIVRLGQELSQKLLHQPTKVFRQAVISQDLATLEVAKAMFCQKKK